MASLLTSEFVSLIGMASPDSTWGDDALAPRASVGPFEVLLRLGGNRGINR